MANVMVKPSYSVWLLPKKEDHEYLLRIILDLSKKYGGSDFCPHITVFSSIESDLQFVINAVKASIKGIIPFAVKKSELKFSDEKFKAVYMRMELNHQLVQINERLDQIFS